MWLVTSQFKLEQLAEDSEAKNLLEAIYINFSGYFYLGMLCCSFEAQIQYHKSS